MEEYMTARIEQAYHDGFLDGQRFVLDAYDEVVERSVGRTEAWERFAEIIEDIRKELESS